MGVMFNFTAQTSISFSLQYLSRAIGRIQDAYE